MGDVVGNLDGLSKEQLLLNYVEELRRTLGRAKAAEAEADSLRLQLAALRAGGGTSQADARAREIVAAAVADADAVRAEADAELRDARARAEREVADARTRAAEIAEAADRQAALYMADAVAAAADRAEAAMRDGEGVVGELMDALRGVVSDCDAVEPALRERLEQTSRVRGLAEAAIARIEAGRVSPARRPVAAPARAAGVADVDAASARPASPRPVMTRGEERPEPRAASVPAPAPVPRPAPVTAPVPAPVPAPAAVPREAANPASADLLASLPEVGGDDEFEFDPGLAGSFVEELSAFEDAASSLEDADDFEAFDDGTAAPADDGIVIPERGRGRRSRGGDARWY